MKDKGDLTWESYLQVVDCYADSMILLHIEHCINAGLILESECLVHSLIPLFIHSLPSISRYLVLSVNGEDNVTYPQRSSWGLDETRHIYTWLLGECSAHSKGSRNYKQYRWLSPSVCKPLGHFTHYFDGFSRCYFRQVLIDVNSYSGFEKRYCPSYWEKGILSILLGSERRSY